MIKSSFPPWNDTTFHVPALDDDDDDDDDDDYDVNENNNKINNDNNNNAYIHPYICTYTRPLLKDEWGNCH